MSMLSAEKPKIRPARAGIQRAAGGLSTVMALPASRDPNSSAVQSLVPAWIAAA